MHNIAWFKHVRKALTVTVLAAPLGGLMAAPASASTNTPASSVPASCSWTPLPFWCKSTTVGGAAETSTARPVKTRTRWSQKQRDNAALIVRIGNQRGVPRKAKVIALVTAMQESSLGAITCCDHDSGGLFQQRPSMGWGSWLQVRNPNYATSKFYSALFRVRGWERMSVSTAAQKVQRSKYPYAYSKWVSDAEVLAGP